MSPSDPPVAAPTPPDVTKEEFIRQVKDEALRLQRAYKLSSAAALQEAFHRFEPFHSRVAAPTPETPSQWKWDYSFAAEAITAFLKMGVCPHGYDREDLQLFAERLAGAVSHPQPEKKTTNDDKTEESDGSVENAMANGETRGMDGGGLDGPAPDDRRVPAADDDPAHTRPTGTYNCPVCGWNVPHREHAGAIIERQIFELTRWREWWRHVDLMIRSGIRPGCGTSVATRNCDDLLVGRGANMLAPFDR